MSPSQQLTTRVLSDIQSRVLVSRGQGVLLAVSGGADSTALVLLMQRIAPELNLKLTAAHFNHRIRPESGEDALFVRTLCKKLDIPLVAGEWENVPQNPSEEQARQARWAFLKQTAIQAGANWIATGHTADDRVETLLLNLLRGTGISGLGGIRWCNPPRVSPLLGQWRSDLEAFLRQEGQDWREDSSNAEHVYTRNRVRGGLLPSLAQDYNPNIRQSLWETAETACLEDALLQEQAHRVLSSALVPDTSPWSLVTSRYRIALCTQMLASEPPALVRRALRLALARLTGSMQDISFQMVHRLADACTGDTPLFDLGLGVSAECRREELVLTRQPRLLPQDFPAGSPPWVHPVLGWEVYFTGLKDPTALESIPARATSGALLRAWQDGDRMRPAGLGGTKKLQDLFVDARLPAWMRRHWPVVVQDGEVIWVPLIARVATAEAPGWLNFTLRKDP